MSRQAFAHVDRETCFSFANCTQVLPGVFSLDADGKSVPLRVEAPIEALREAVDACPRWAISLIDEEGETIYP